MNKLIRKFLVVCLSIYLILFPPLAYAAVGSWAADGVKYLGSQVAIDAIKNGFKSSIRYTPNAAKMGKFLLKGGGAVAVAYAISQLLGDGVDWVLDPDNNTVRYVDGGEYEYVLVDNPTQSYSSAEEACNYIYSSEFLNRFGLKRTRGYTGLYFDEIVYSSSGLEFDCRVQVGYLDTDYLFNIGGFTNSYRGRKLQVGTEHYKNLPIDAVANQVITNAQNGNADARQAIEQYITDLIVSGQLDDLLNEYAKPTNITKPLDPPKYKDIPKIDTSSIISAINSVGAILSAVGANIVTAVNYIPDTIRYAYQSMLDQLAQWYDGLIRPINDIRDWALDEPNYNNNSDTLDITDDSDLDFRSIAERQYLFLPRQCPQSPVFTFAWLDGSTKNLVFDISIFCRSFEMFSPLILIYAYIRALEIVGNSL